MAWPPPVKSDRAGRFEDHSFDRDAVGQEAHWFFQAEHPDFATCLRPWIERLPPNASGVLELDVVLARGRGLAGRVVDEQDRPVADAEIVIEAARFTDREHNFFEKHACTNRNGRFRFKGLWACPHTVKATAPGRAPSAVDVDLGEAKPPPIDRRRGGEITITLPRGSTLRARAVDARGDPRPGVPVQGILWRPFFLEYFSRTDAGGWFTITGLPASGEIDVRIGDEWQRSIALPAELVTLDPVLPVDLCVVLVDPKSGTPLAPPGMAFDLVNGSAIAGYLEPGGRIVFKRVSPGRHRIVPVLPGRASFESELVLPPGRLARPFEIYVPKAADVRGTVRNGAGDPIAGVAVAASNGVFGGRREAVTTPDGGYRLDGVAGNYTVAFSKWGFAPRVLGERAFGGDGRLRLDTTLLRGATVSGVVRTSKGRPILGVLIQAGETTRGPSPATVTDADGAYTIVNVPEGPLVLSAGATTRAIVVEDGASIREDFSIEYP